MDKIYKILPKYAFIPIIITFVYNLLVYYGSKLITENMTHYDLSCEIDAAIPFVPEMMIVYVLAYVTWGIGFIVIGRESKQVCYEVMTAELIAKTICLICFIVLPTTIIAYRPDVAAIEGNGIVAWLTRFIFNADVPVSLFPSIHCLENWIVFRGAMKCKKAGRGYTAVMFIVALAVFASTVMVKQHFFVDIIGGVAVVEIGLLVSKRFRLYNVYYKLESKLEKFKKQ